MEWLHTLTFNRFCPTGHINMEEFIKGAQQDTWLLSMLKLDMNPAEWMMEQRRKSAHFWKNVKTAFPSLCVQNKIYFFLVKPNNISTFKLVSKTNI